MLSDTLHFYSNWAKQRIAEMDAAIVSLDRHVKRFLPGREGSQLIAGLKKRRERFESLVNKQARKGEAAWKHSKTRLNTEWKAFDAEVAAYVKMAKRQSGFQKSAFGRLSAAQSKAWRDVERSLRALVRKAAPARRTDFSTAIKRIRNNGVSIKKRARKLAKSTTISWSAMYSALKSSRKAFDKANREAAKAMRKAFR